MVFFVVMNMLKVFFIAHIKSAWPLLQNKLKKVVPLYCLKELIVLIYPQVVLAASIISKSGKGAMS